MEVVRVRSCYKRVRVGVVDSMKVIIHHAMLKN
jgi:phosphotransferase system IIB component